MVKWLNCPNSPSTGEVAVTLIGDVLESMEEILPPRIEVNVV